MSQEEWDYHRATYNPPPNLSPPSINDAATTAGLESDRTDDYSTHTRKIGSSPDPHEHVYQESEPWQLTTTPANVLPSPSLPVALDLLSSSAANIWGWRSAFFPPDSYPSPSDLLPSIEPDLQSSRQAFSYDVWVRAYLSPPLDPISRPQPKCSRSRRVLQKLHAEAKLIRCSAEYGEEDYHDFCNAERIQPVILDSVEKDLTYRDGQKFWLQRLHRHQTGQYPLHAIEYMDQNRVWHLTTDYPPNTSPIPDYLFGPWSPPRSFTEAYYPKYFEQQTALGFDFPAIPALKTAIKPPSTSRATTSMTSSKLPASPTADTFLTTSAKDDAEIVSLETDLDAFCTFSFEASITESLKSKQESRHSEYEY